MGRVIQPRLMLSSDGFNSGATPWRAVQQAAWVVVKKMKVSA